MFRCHQVIQREVDVYRAQFGRNGVDVLEGHAAFEDPHTIRVTGGGGEGLFRAERFVIATGTTPVLPRGVPIDHAAVIDSDGLFRLTTIPRTMIVVGGGVIGVEYACMFSTLGVAVTLVDGRRRFFDFFDAEIVEVFEAAINNGWDCAVTNGESLSRVLAFDRHPEIAADFNQTEQDWWASGHPDHVNDNSAGDTDQLAAGCGDLFLYYLHSQLTFDWPPICSAGGRTLGAGYQSLTGYDPQQGFNDFIAALSTIDQGGTLSLPPSGNPFPIKT